MKEVVISKALSYSVITTSLKTGWLWWKKEIKKKYYRLEGVWYDIETHEEACEYDQRRFTEYIDGK